MLNTEQLLIKAAQYFDMNLKELGLKQTKQKERLYKNQLSDKKYLEIIDKILRNIKLLNINSKFKVILQDFLRHYSYLSKEIYGNYDDKREKEVDWLLLKHFVIPYFAVKISENFAEYDKRIDNGLPGGLFWYLPILRANNKIDFPINTVMNWWIDLFGSSKDKFYHYNKSTISPYTLKKWNNELVLPDITTIQTLLNSDYSYNGYFEYNPSNTVEHNFKLALKFIEDKSISIDKLKDEIPNIDNIIDRLSANELSNEEQKKFILFIATRWAKPSSKQIEQLLIIARVSQAIYKELCLYYNINTNEFKIEKNSIFQLNSFYQYLYNIDTSFIAEIPYEISPLFEKYIQPITKLKNNQKEALDNIMSIISNKLASDKIKYDIDEIVLILSEDKYFKENAIKNIKEEDDRINNQSSYEEDVLKVINDIKNLNTILELRYYIVFITDCKLLYNVGSYFRGHNFLTNEKVYPNNQFALEVYLHYYKVATEEIHIKNAIPNILDLLTFPFFPRISKKELAQEFINKLGNLIDTISIRERISFLQYKAYHEINTKNTKKALLLIKEFELNTSNLKFDEYIPDLLFISENLEFVKKDKQFHKRLIKRNQKHPKHTLYNHKLYFY